MLIQEFLEECVRYVLDRLTVLVVMSHTVENQVLIDKQQKFIGQAVNHTVASVY